MRYVLAFRDNEKIPKPRLQKTFCKKAQLCLRGSVTLVDEW